jgi:hypothetical protein
VNIGTTHDTGTNVCDSIKQWWTQAGQYDGATVMNVLADSSGSNSYRHYVFFEPYKNWLMKLG